MLLTHHITPAKNEHEATMKTDELFAEAELLPVDMKAILVDRLLHSLHPTNRAIDDAWIIEAERRVKDLQSGKAKLIPGQEVLANPRKMLGG